MSGSLKFKDKFVCLNNIRYLTTLEQKVALFTGVLSANGYGHKDMVKFAEEHGMFSDVDEWSLGTAQNLNKYFAGSSHCANACINSGINPTACRKLCDTCSVSNTKSLQINFDAEEKLLSYAYHFGFPDGSKPCEYTTEVIVTYGTDSLITKVLPVKKAVDEYFRELTVVCTKDPVTVAREIAFNLAANKFGKVDPIEKDNLKEAIVEKIVSWLNIPVEESEYESTLLGVIDRYHVRKDATSPKELKKTKFESVDTSSISFVENISDTSPAETTQDDNNQSEPETDLNDTSSEPSDEEIQSDPSKEPEAKPANVPDTVAPEFYSDAKGFLFDKASLLNKVGLIQNARQEKFLVDLLIRCRYVFAEVVTISSVTGMLFWSDEFDALLPEKCIPVFVPEKQYSPYLFHSLINARSGKIITFNLELFCEHLRKIDFKDFLDCVSIRAAYMALAEENRELCPVEEILRFTGVVEEKTDYDLIDDFYKNYKKISANLLLKLDETGHKKFFSIYNFYEIFLSTSNRISNVLTCNFVNLKRENYLKNIFTYGLPLKKRTAGTVISTSFTFEGMNYSAYPRFFPSLINRIMNEQPITSMKPYLLSYDDNHINIFISRTYKDDVSIANEQIYMAIINTAKQFRLSAPIISSKIE